MPGTRTTTKKTGVARPRAAGKTSRAASRRAAAPARKTAKKAAKKVARKAARSVVSQLSRRSTNRTSNRPLAVIDLPVSGDLRAELERRIALWIKKPKRRGDYVSYALAAMLEDAEEMLEQREADLAEFRRQEMPVTPRYLDWLALHVDELHKVGVERRIDRGVFESVGEDAGVAMMTALDARNNLSRRAAACGIPLNIFDVRRATGSPRTLYYALLEVCDATREIVDQFDSPSYAKKLLQALEQATSALGDVVGARRQGRQDVAGLRARRQALARSMYDAMQWLSAWGKAMAGGDPEAQRRWRLDKTFPGQARLKDEDPQALVDGAITDPPVDSAED